MAKKANKRSKIFPDILKSNSNERPIVPFDEKATIENEGEL